MKISPVQLEWRNLKYVVETEDKDAIQPLCPCAPRIMTDRVILNNLSGYVAPGSMLAIMGPSGSGKTTLLNALAGRINRKRFEGDVLINNKQADRSQLKVLAGYVPQDDILYGSQTVYEAMMFYAHLKLPHLTLQEKDQKVRSLIDVLGLAKVTNSLIGFVGAEAATSGLQRGISGGERKRTSIGCQLIADPALLFLDEPTTGLDSFAAEAVIRVLAKQIQLGRTIIFTIHQPSTDVIKLFDQLLIIAYGRTIYFGPQVKALNYFKSVGLPCAADENPGDHFVEVIFREKAIKGDVELDDSDEEKSKVTFEEDAKKSSKKKSKKKKNRFSIENPPSPKYVPPVPPADDKGKEKEVTSGPSASLGEDRVIELAQRYSSSKYAKLDPPAVPEKTSLPTLRRAETTVQMKQLFKRNVNHILRDPSALKAGMIQQAVIGIIFGIIYLNLGNDQASLQNRAGALFFGAIFLMFGGLLGPLALFSVERKQFLFQHMEALYQPSTYYICKVLPEICPIFINVSIFSLIYYFMLDLNRTVAHFFVFWILCCLLVISAQAFAFFLTSAIPDYGVLMSVFPIFFMPQMIFSGFYLNSATTPVYFIWVEYLSLIKYTFRPLCVNELHDEAFYCSAEDLATIYNGVCPYTVGDQWLTFRDLNGFPIWGDALILVLFTLFYHFVGFLLLRRLAAKSTN